jgi:predicted DNA-binding transcriptional regulator AlpA
MSEGAFPSSIRLTGRAVCWDSQAIEDWILSRITGASA